jgi:hypothetical protein
MMLPPAAFNRAGRRQAIPKEPALPALEGQLQRLELMVASQFCFSVQVAKEQSNRMARSDKFDHPINGVRGVATRFMMPAFSSWDFRGCNELFRHGGRLYSAITSSRARCPLLDRAR